MKKEIVNDLRKQNLIYHSYLKLLVKARETFKQIDCTGFICYLKSIYLKESKTVCFPVFFLANTLFSYGLKRINFVTNVDLFLLLLKFQDFNTCDIH